MLISAALVFLQLLQQLGPSGGEVPPQQPPPSLLPSLTLEGQVPLEYYYVDDSNRGNGQWRLPL